MTDEKDGEGKGGEEGAARLYTDVGRRTLGIMGIPLEIASANALKPQDGTLAGGDVRRQVGARQTEAPGTLTLQAVCVAPVPSEFRIVALRNVTTDGRVFQSEVFLDVRSDRLIHPGETLRVVGPCPGLHGVSWTVPEGWRGKFRLDVLEWQGKPSDRPRSQIAKPGLV
jgi:hypothetical protein